MFVILASEFYTDQNYYKTGKYGNIKYGYYAFHTYPNLVFLI
ncbi:hypothetical protein [Mycoplasmopsis agalactiae]|nr:hypothetical protein [Mycoplasmopsis agalactiae]